MSIAIVCDSTAVMDQDTINKYENLFIVPLQILVNDDVYNDGVDLTQKEFFFDENENHLIT